MRVGIIQSNYLPWRGYFDFIASVDLFVFLDDAQYTKRDWRNRNRIKTESGLQWITVPVNAHRPEPPIRDTPIDSTRPWVQEHRRKIGDSFRDAPFRGDAMALFDAVTVTPARTISELNRTAVRAICEYLGIRTPLCLSDEFEPSGAKTDRLLSILRRAGATRYLSGPAAREYLDVDAFREAGIGLDFKSYDYPAYPQQWGPFEGGVTVLDLIANCGPGARDHLHSRTPDERVA